MTLQGSYTGRFINGVLIRLHQQTQLDAEGETYITVKVTGHQNLMLVNRLDANHLWHISDSLGGQPPTDSGVVALYIPLGCVHLDAKDEVTVWVETIGSVANSTCAAIVVYDQFTQHNPLAWDYHTDTNFTVSAVQSVWLYHATLQTETDNITIKCGKVNETFPVWSSNVYLVARGGIETENNNIGLAYKSSANDNMLLPCSINTNQADMKIIVCSSPLSFPQSARRFN